MLLVIGTQTTIVWATIMHFCIEFQWHQVEHPDNWIIFGAPWEIVRPEWVQEVHLFGRCEQVEGPNGGLKWAWVDSKPLLGFPYDIPIVGYGTRTVNILRLWASKATEEFDL